MPFLDHDGRRLHYAVLGAGKPVALVHGFTNAGLSWMHQIAALVFDGYQVIVPDLYGHGLSAPAQAVTTVDDLTRDLIALLDHLHIERASICGLSLGGMVAQLAALDHPQRVDRLIVANSRATFADPQLADVVAGWVQLFEQPQGPLKRFEATWPLMLNETFRQSAAGIATYESWCGLAARLDGRSLANVALGMRTFDVRDRLPEIDRPTLVISGDHDKLFPPAQTFEISQRIPGARFEVIANAAHISCLDSADQFNRLLLQFLNDPAR